ncbi:MAG: A/G-specific adenine glycosylase [Betaproteobacteria bacterium RIFCSPLOWO2_12_FULL_63_13]|nr:MAG: A/G-specific adenine glycosylase [Betaproteobacteria bacterium RIFCSPLOWO2_12_FULL_63_13]
MRDFSKRLIAWQKVHGRHGLPWQRSRDPYRIWLSEVMLQQTQVGTVIPYYEQFLDRFPDLTRLARAPLAEVLRLWAGLGYYSRARNLHRAALKIVDERRGAFPRRRVALEELPGVGRSTAAAVAVFAFGAREAILDGNAKRVLARHFAVEGVPGNSAYEAKLWSLAESLLPARDVPTYTQGLMDLGTAVCTRTSPGCAHCPVASSCVALKRGCVAAFPTPLRRKPARVRSVAMLLLLRGSEILLQARPPAGIWGGLWSLPEMPIGVDARAHCAAELGCEVGTPEALAPLRHRFTHFTLDIRPYRCEVSRVMSRTEEPRRVWYGLAQAEAAGVPVPVRKLLRGLRRNT